MRYALILALGVLVLAAVVKAAATPSDENCMAWADMGDVDENGKIVSWCVEWAPPGRTPPPAP